MFIDVFATVLIDNKQRSRSGKLLLVGAPAVGNVGKFLHKYKEEKRGTL